MPNLTEPRSMMYARMRAQSISFLSPPIIDSQ
jgi:hypothetical protein